jgi:hypothetical protein
VVLAGTSQGAALAFASNAAAGATERPQLAVTFVPPADSADAGVPAADAATAPRPRAIKTVFVVMMENTDWAAIHGSPDAPYINNVLLPRYAHAENYRSGNHPSLPNYMSLEAADNLGMSNGLAQPSTVALETTDHLSSYLHRAGVTWRNYHENLPGDGNACDLSDPGPPYSADHNANLYFRDVVQDPAYCMAHIRPYREFEGDLASNRAAQYNFVVPNDYDQGEKLAPPLNNGIRQADTWLAREIPKIMASQAYRDGGVILVLWDEGYSCCNNASGLIVVSDLAKPGYSNGVTYTHASTVRTVQEIFGVTPLLRGAASASSLSDLFTQYP